MGIDLNALAGRLAHGLEAEHLAGRATDAATRPRGDRPQGAVPVETPAVAPRGVLFTRGDTRLGDLVDHTLLRPDATLPEIERHCAEARDHRLAAVCVNPIWVPDCARLLRGSHVRISTVVGFPFGATQPMVKAAEAALAVQQGAQELDVVVSLGALRAGAWREVEQEIAVMLRAASGALVKVVLESALLPPLALVHACQVAAGAGAHYVKTSTGFHSAGGATPETVALMRLAVGDRLGVKASGGIRDAATAVAMLDAGATRLGTSAGVELAEVRGPGARPVRELVGEQPR